LGWDTEKGRFQNGPFSKGGFLKEKGGFRNRPFFKGRFLNQASRDPLQASTFNKMLLNSLYKGASMTCLHGGQNCPLIVKKGAFEKRPFFQGRFSDRKGWFKKPPFFQGSIYIAV
jgi:hypothetical protein